MNSKSRLIQFLDELICIGTTTEMTFYFVGGCVRDAFFGVPITDIDIALDGDVNEVFKRIEKTYDVKKSMFDTLTVTIDDMHVDIAGFRREYYPDFSGFPVVNKGTLESDLNRRDFTINTGYVRLDVVSVNALLSDKTLSRDLVFACHDNFFEDIEAKRLRTLKSDSFSEDATRMLRAVKYLIVHTLVFEDETGKQFSMGINEKWFTRCSEDRYKKILLEFAYHEAWKQLMDAVIYYGLFQRESDVLIGKADFLFDRLEALERQIGVFDHGIVFLLATHENQLDYWVNAPRRISSHARQILSISEKSKEAINLMKCHEWFRGASKETIAFFHVCLNCNPSVKRFVIDGLVEIKLEICGKDLIEMGISEGAVIGEILNGLLAYAVSKGRNLKKTEELEWVERKIDEYRSKT